MRFLSSSWFSAHMCLANMASVTGKVNFRNLLFYEMVRFEFVLLETRIECDFSLRKAISYSGTGN